MPKHFKRICSAIDQLPSNLDFDVPSLPETGLSQGLESYHLSQDDDTVSSITNQHQVTPDTSIYGTRGSKEAEEENGRYEIASRVSEIRNNVAISSKLRFSYVYLDV